MKDKNKIYDKLFDNMWLPENTAEQKQFKFEQREKLLDQLEAIWDKEKYD